MQLELSCHVKNMHENFPVSFQERTYLTNDLSLIIFLILSSSCHHTMAIPSVDIETQFAYNKIKYPRLHNNSDNFQPKFIDKKTFNTNKPNIKSSHSSIKNAFVKPTSDFAPASQYHETIIVTITNFLRKDKYDAFKAVSK